MLICIIIVGIAKDHNPKVKSLNAALLVYRSLVPFSFFCLPKRKKQRKGQPKTNAPLFLAGQRT